MDKIRDLRSKFFQIDDEYLNGYAKLCGINATGVYLSMCRHANKQQTCFPSKKLIAEELNISERSVYNAIKKLEEYKIIKVEQQGRKTNGSFKNLLYTLLSKTQWQDKPSATCAVGKDCMPPSATGAVDRRQQVPNKETHINNTHNKETHIVGKADGSSLRNLEEFIIWCKKSTQRHIHIIADYADEKKMKFETKDQWQQFLKRNLRPARSLAPYSDKQIGEAMTKLNKAKKEYLTDWTLETLNKFLDK